MKLVVPMSVLVVALSACANAPPVAPQCGDHGSRAEDARREFTKVRLPSMPKEPVFYLVSDHYAVLMPPAHLTELLASWVKSGTSTSNEMLLDAVQADIPLKDDTDLRKYSIRQTRFDFSLPHIAAALLHEGHASVIDLWELDEDKELAEITIASVFGGLSERRYFCDSAGEAILSVTDMIVQQNSPNNRVQPTLAHSRG